MRRLYMGSILLMFLSGLSIFGCDDDCTAPTITTMGVITGTVGDGGPWLDGTFVEYDSVDDANSAFRIRAMVDSTGTYRMIVPPGGAKLCMGIRNSSRVAYYTAQGPVADYRMADTLDVFDQELKADFDLGRASVEVNGLSESELDRLNLYLQNEPDYSGSSRTGERSDGSFSYLYRMIPPGPYWGRLSQWGGSLVYAVSELPGHDDQALLTIVSGAETKSVVVIPDPVRVSGSFSGSWAEGEYINTQIEVFGEGPEDRIYGINGEDDGTFVFDDYLLRPLRLKARVSGSTVWIGGIDYDSATVFDTGAGLDITGIEHFVNTLVLEIQSEEGTVFVNACDKLYFEPFLDLYDVMTTCNWPGTFTTRRYVNVYPGQYYLQLMPGDDGNTWLPRFHDDQATLETATPIVIEPDVAVTTATMNLVEGGRLRGQLSGAALPTSEDLDMILVKVIGDNGFYTRAEPLTYDALTGDYDIYRLEDGDYKLCVIVGDSVMSWYPGVESAADATVVSIVDHDVVEGISWDLGP